MKWQEITPNENYDWINQRHDNFESFMSLGDKKDASTKTVFDVYSMGVKTNRDTWVYNFCQDQLSQNMIRMIDFYNHQVTEYNLYSSTNKPDIKKIINTDTKKIKWTEDLIKSVAKGVVHSFQSTSLIKSIYRPFCKQYLYYNKDFNWTHHLIPKIFPNQNLENLVICVTGVGVVKDFSALISNLIPDLCIQGAATAGQCFPLYTYEKQSELGELFATATTEQYTKKENIPDSILKEYQQKYQDTTITKSDIFYYIYGVLHSPEYKQRFASDLKKMLPRIPFTADFWTFSQAGRELA
jgi:predicted helicase